MARNRPKLMHVKDLIGFDKRPKILIGNNWYTYSGVHNSPDNDTLTVHFFIGDRSGRVGLLIVPEDFEIWVKERATRLNYEAQPRTTERTYESEEI